MKLARKMFMLLALSWVTLAQALPEIQSWKTGHGAKVLFVAAPELPMVDIRLVFDAGAARDGALQGVARFTNGMLDQGADGLNAGQIAQGFENRGATISNGSERDMAWLSLRSLTDDKLLEPSLELFGKVLSKPDFPADDFAREQKRTLVSLQYQKQKPASIASRRFYQDLYGEHPYASDPTGTEATVAALTTGDLKDFYRQYYVARNAVVVIVGALSEKQAAAIASRLVDRLPDGQHAVEVPPVEELKEAREDFSEHPSSQSHVLIGAPGMHRGDVDYFPLYVGNHILGGSGLVSRISQEVREKRGLSYSAYSYFTPMRRNGPFTLGLQTRNDQRDEAIMVLRDTLREFLAEGPSDKELVAAKNNIIGGFPLRLSSNSKISEYLAMIGFYDLPLDYLDRFAERVQAVTVKQIRNAWQRRVHPDRMVTVIVGGSG